MQGLNIDTLFWDEYTYDSSAPVPQPLAGLQLMPADFGLPGETKRFFIAILPTGEHLRLTKRAYEIVRLLQDAPPGTSYAEMAQDLSERWCRPFSAQALQQLMLTTLAPYGLLAGVSPTILPRRSMLTLRIPLLPRHLVAFLTQRLTWLYHPICAVPVSVGAIVIFILVASSLLPATGIAQPQDVAWAYFYGLLSALWHELGHATACRRFKAPTGIIGFGLYFIYPAFYTDVTATWRLPRRQRAAVDLGGIYFQCIALLLFYGLFLLTGEPSYRLALILNTGIITFSLNPFLRFDGYWMLNDLLGLVALDRFLRVIGLALITGLRQGGFKPLRATRAVAANLKEIIPGSIPLWSKVLLGIYMATTGIFWFWFLAALGWWALRLLPGYPLQAEHFALLLQHHQWTAVLPFFITLLTPWFVLFGLVSALRKLGRGSRRLLTEHTTLQDRVQRI